MPSPRPNKSALSALWLVPLLMVALLSLACSRMDTEPTEEGPPPEVVPDEMSLVWEAWGLIKNSYVEAGDLDSQQATGSMVLSMLEGNGRSAYPFLAELGSVTAQPPIGVPEELVDVWRASVLYREKWPDVATVQLVDTAIDGMLEALVDDTIVRLTPEAYARAVEELESSYQGIGAFVETVDGMLVLVPMEDSPAEKAGLEEGDVVLQVDGEPVEGRDRRQIVDQVRGPAATKVTLLVERAGEEEPLEVDVVRGDIRADSVARSFFPGSIGYIYISDFVDHTHDELLDVLDEFKRFDTLALIVDLRSNQGSSVEVARQVASEFLSEGTFSYEVDRDGERKDQLIAEGGLAVEELPMVVIVNGATGSMAEAVAGALQEAGRATVLGMTTLGDGSTRVYQLLSDGSAIYLPVSLWYTPSGKLIRRNGIEPDITVELTIEDRAAGVDSQLTRAYDHLDDQLPEFR